MELLEWSWLLENVFKRKMVSKIISILFIYNIDFKMYLWPSFNFLKDLLSQPVTHRCLKNQFRFSQLFLTWMIKKQRSEIDNRQGNNSECSSCLFESVLTDWQSRTGQIFNLNQCHCLLDEWSGGDGCMSMIRPIVNRLNKNTICGNANANGTKRNEIKFKSRLTLFLH